MPKERDPDTYFEPMHVGMDVRVNGQSYALLTPLPFIPRDYTETEVRRELDNLKEELIRRLKAKGAL